MIRLALASLALMGCGPLTQTTSSPLPACTGSEVTVWGDDPTGCDLTPPQTLTILGISEAECDDAGGRYVYEACLDADY